MKEPEDRPDFHLIEAPGEIDETKLDGVPVYESEAIKDKPLISMLGDKIVRIVKPAPHPSRWQRFRTWLKNLW